MSRSGYSEDCDQWDLIRWRGAVNSAIKGRRGQQFLRELASALDAMPEKRLIAHELVADGSYCTLGAVGAARGLEMAKVDPEDREQVSKLFGIAPALAAEIVFENDERNYLTECVEVEICGPLRPYELRRRWMRVEVARAEEHRWQRMREWVAKHITEESPHGR